MKVFVAGATGAIGRRLVPRLVAAGHEVTGMTRSEGRAAGLRAQGAQAVLADAFDRDAVRAAVTGAETEVLVHQLTALGDRFDPKTISEEYKATTRLRTEGTEILLDAARAAGTRRVVAQSIAFLYAPEGDGPLDESAPPFAEAAEPFGTAVRGALDLERRVTAAEGIEGVVLRYGFFYGPGTFYARKSPTADDVRRRRQPVVGKGAGVFSFIHVDDAAGATVAAVEGGPAGIFNVVDDEPAPMREWLPAFAQAIGAKKPLRVPAFVAKLAAPRALVDMATSLRGASNARFKEAFSWQPRYSSWRQGFRDGLG